MIRTGDTLHNPVTGERPALRPRPPPTRTASTSSSRSSVEPNGAVAAAHVHPYQTETFEIVEGDVCVQGRRKETIVAGAGDTVASSPARRTSSGTPATDRAASAPRSAPRSSSSS